MDRTHRRFSPSQAERFIACPGSVRLLERTPARVETSYSIEGTKAHDVLAVALQNGERKARIAHAEHSLYFAEDFEDDFFKSVQSALNYVYDILDEHKDAVLYVETYVDPPSEAAPGETAGYCDIAIYIPSTRTLYVIDYKHGAGVSKSAKGNPQPMQYGAGFLYQDNPLVDPAGVDRVIIVIVQPRSFHEEGPIREHEVTPYELYEYLTELDGSITRCLDPNAPLVPGEEQCRFCDANTTCPARESTSLSNAVNVHFKSITDVKQSGIPKVENIDVARLAHILQWEPALSKFLSDVKAHAYELMKQGHDVPGFKLVETQARREWYGTVETLAFKLAALAGTDVSEVLDISLPNITDAEKMVVDAFKANVGHGKKKLAAEDAKKAFAQLTLKKSSGNVTVAPMDDPRPAVNKAATAFAGVAGTLIPPLPPTT